VCQTNVWYTRIMARKTPAGRTRARILEFVRGRLLEGRPPTVREVQDAFGFRAVQSAREHLEALVADGKLAKDKGKARGYGLPAGGPRGAVLVPLLGRVQAGDPTVAVEEPLGYLPVRPRSAPDGLFALRVRGESMTGAGILPGDVVVVRRQATAEPGDVVVAMVGDEATVKTLRRRRGRLELHPANPAFEPIVPRTGALALLGKVVEVRRILDGSLTEGP
jgi:repressor LexA